MGINTSGPIEPIIACSSGNNSNSAITIIRVGGFEDLEGFQELFELNLSKVKPRTNYLSKLIYNDYELDEVVFSYYQSPKSYNGENILELNVHGNKHNVNRIIVSS